MEAIYRMMNDSPKDFTGPVNLGNPVSAMAMSSDRAMNL